MQSNRCGNYLLETELIVVSGAPVILRIPIRRCLLSEQMLTQMNLTDKGREVVHKLTLAISNHVERSQATAAIPTDSQESSGDQINQDRAFGNEESPVEHLVLRAALGPDLEPIHHADCLVSRCLQSCTPEYKNMLLQYGPPATVEERRDTGCFDTRPLTEEAY